ncbi:MAG: hypothetical protein AB1758_00305 [Candidatus Eremiobacterota bacterium]
MGLKKVIGGAALGGALGYGTGEVLGIDSKKTALAGAGIGALSQAGLFDNPASGAATGALMGGLAGSALSPVLGESAAPIGALGGGLLGYSEGATKKARKARRKALRRMRRHGVRPVLANPHPVGVGLPQVVAAPPVPAFGGGVALAGGPVPGMDPMSMTLMAAMLLSMTQQTGGTRTGGGSWAFFMSA